MKRNVFLSTMLAACLTLSLAPTAFAEEAAAPDLRPRTLVTTDLECDDIDSMLPLLLYSNDIDIAGIVVSASTHHWTGDGEHRMEEVIDSFQKGGELTEWRPMELDWLYNLYENEYAEAYENLVKHDSSYPSPEDLAAVTKIGNVEFEGDYRFDTEGSDYIKELLLDDDERTLYVQAWGGANSLARALYSLEETYKDTEEWDAIYDKVTKKAILVSWGDQDNTYADYMSVNWPDLRHLYCVTSGIGYGTSRNCTVPYRFYFMPEWLTENIKFDHGSLMGKYLLYGDGIYYEGETPDNQFGDLEVANDPTSWLRMFTPDGFEQYEFISEGDSPCWMMLIPVGLRGLEDYSYGSWGGRLGEDGHGIPEYDPTIGYADAGFGVGAYGVWRWFPAFMNDWAARADWCVSEYADANHQPVVSADVLDFEAAPGETVELAASAEDPDGNDLAMNWYVYSAACSYSGAYLADLDVWAHGTATTSFTVPQDAADGDYFNLVFEATDNGEPALTRYAQAIVKVVAPAEEAAAEEAPAEEAVAEEAPAEETAAE